MKYSKYLSPTIIEETRVLGNPQEYLALTVDETVFVEFEGEQFRAPKEYKKLLKHKYGNYMELPPVEKRVATHDYKAYRK